MSTFQETATTGQASGEDEYAATVGFVARLMAVAAVTAPKAKGEDYVLVKIISGLSVQHLAAEMVAYGERHGKKNFDRDGKNIENSQCVVLFGMQQPATAKLNCGACGYETCAELELQEKSDGEFTGPMCVYRLLDLGIALGSAVKTASLLNVDNRIMYRIGAVARATGIVDWDFVMGVPLSVSAKNIYFDR